MVFASGGRPGGRVAIVTGSSRGVGRETARRLASLGYAVVVNYAHDQRAAEATVEAILSANGAAVAVRADVDDDLDVERLFAETIEAFGPVDAVVHAVRGRVAATPVAQVALDEFDALLRTNIRATFIVNRMAAREVRNGGAIVNLSRSAVASPLASAPYAATAAATDTLTRVLALELRDRDITVNGVSFGTARDRLAGQVADIIAFLLSEAGHSITGQVFHAEDRPRGPAGNTR
jgi:3-oxoacyl-[acyl-carrier protein] reductase